MDIKLKGKGWGAYEGTLFQNVTPDDDGDVNLHPIWGASDASDPWEVFQNRIDWETGYAWESGQVDATGATGFGYEIVPENENASGTFVVTVKARDVDELTAVLCALKEFPNKTVVM